ncbi:hypothetical protein CCR75_005287 [Bremia lactucae]|uniref:Uncharacterized protein n=1 Tax=Bremia lactucae TaxID=4779 RepID=A0A976IGU8_BRELC|nr:hypothetical protein CCR75_005287 [Bremia lactucae]
MNLMNLRLKMSVQRIRGCKSAVISLELIIRPNQMYYDQKLACLEDALAKEQIEQPRLLVTR